MVSTPAPVTPRSTLAATPPQNDLRPCSLNRQEEHSIELLNLCFSPEDIIILLRTVSSGQATTPEVMVIAQPTRKLQNRLLTTWLGRIGFTESLRPKQNPRQIIMNTQETTNPRYSPRRPSEAQVFRMQSTMPSNWRAAPVLAFCISLVSLVRTQSSGYTKNCVEAPAMLPQIMLKPRPLQKVARVLSQAKSLLKRSLKAKLKACVGKQRRTLVKLPLQQALSPSSWYSLRKQLTMPEQGSCRVFFSSRACCSCRRILITSIGEASDLEIAAETPLSRNSIANCQKGDHSTGLIILNQIIIGELVKSDRSNNNSQPLFLYLFIDRLLIKLQGLSQTQKITVCMLQVVLCFLLLCLAVAQYNIQLARQSCLIAKMTYLSTQDTASPDCIYCLDGLTDISYLEAPQKKLKGLALFSSKHNMIFVGFRGTKEAQNWSINFKTKTKKYQQCANCLVHTGFSEAASLLYPEVAKAVNNLIQLHGPVPIVMTGHSLGGVLAALIGLQLMQQLKLNTSFTLYTFGAPRAGNKKFGEYSSKMFKESYRVVYKRDAVPHLPLKIQGYTHFGTQIWYELGSSYKTCTGDSKEKCSNSVYLMLLRKNDHRLENYLKLYEEQDQGLLSSSLPTDQLQPEGLQGYELLPLIRQSEGPELIPQFAN